MFNAREIAAEVSENFLSGASDKVEIVYGEFLSVAGPGPDGAGVSAGSTPGERAG